jgi:PAS domain S-box-containing protein
VGDVRVFAVKSVAITSDASLEELLAFERLLSNLSARFANVPGEQVIAEVEIALKQVLKFLDFDRSNFVEFTDEGKQEILCSVALGRVEPLPLGPVPSHLSWFVGELLTGRTTIIRSYEDFPSEAAVTAEYYRRVGIRSQLVIPLSVGGRVVAAIGFGSSGNTRNWPEEFIARVKVIGEVMAQALVRKRSGAALRASEQRWRSIFETSTLAILIVDHDLHYTATNPAFRAMLGYTDDELRRLTPLDITVEEERDTTQKRLADLQQGKIDHYTVEKQYRRKDGKIIWAQVSVARALLSEQEMFIVTMTDITETKRAQDNLRAMQSELARIAQLTTMGQMAASIAHEIKQPLSAITLGCSASLRWLAKKPANLEEVRACIDRIADAGHRMNQVIDGIRVMFQKGNQEKELLSVNQLIGEMLELVREEAQKKRVVVRSDLLDEMRPVLANRIQLQQVMLNLFTNAIEAMESVTDGQRLLQVTSTLHPDGVAIAVEDSGPGMDPRNVDRIFDPFFTTKPHGMGMGLSICRSIVEAHDGRLFARSAADRGSVFEIVLPAGETGPVVGTPPEPQRKNS